MGGWGCQFGSEEPGRAGLPRSRAGIFSPRRSTATLYSIHLKKAQKDPPMRKMQRHIGWWEGGGWGCKFGSKGPGRAGLPGSWAGISSSSQMTIILYSIHLKNTSFGGGGGAAHCTALPLLLASMARVCM
jgi:hypothetical protein